MIGRAILKVTKENLATALKTGSVNVWSSASMAALMEEASVNAVKNIIKKKNETSVGVELNMKHKKPSSIGANVVAVAKILNFSGKKIKIGIEVSDETGIVGTAEHLRVLVDSVDFERKSIENLMKSKKKN